MIAAGIVFCAGRAWAQDAVIRDINGTVEIKAPGSPDWVPARQGQEIGRSTLVSTGFKSTAMIRLGNSTLIVQPLTRLSLEDIVRAGNAEKVNVNLRAGRIRADVKPPVGGSSEFTVRSPIATASVRGTVFEFDGTNLMVEEGTVVLSGESGRPTPVREGQASVVDELGRAAPAWEAAVAELVPNLPAGTESGVSVMVPDPSAVAIESGAEPEALPEELPDGMTEVAVGIDW
jgi:hypothetical protein